MHVLWETDRWLQKHCVPNTADVRRDAAPCKDNADKGTADSEEKVPAATGGGTPELVDSKIEDTLCTRRSLLW